MIPLHDPDIRRRSTPVVVYTLIVINVLIFVFEWLVLSSDQGIAFTYMFGAIPAELTGGAELTQVQLGPGGRVIDVASPIPTEATVFTSMFLHGGFIHLGSNMLFLWVFGDNIEDRFGKLRFLLFYLGAGVLAVIAQVYVAPESQVPMVGASGAIAGVLGAYILMFPHSRVHTLLFFFFIIHLRLPAYVLLGGWALLQAVSGFGSLGVAGESGVAYFAHIGGFMAGLAVGLLYRLFRGSAGPPPPAGPSKYWRGRPID